MAQSQPQTLAKLFKNVQHFGYVMQINCNGDINIETDPMLIDFCCYLSDRIWVGVRGSLAMQIDNPFNGHCRRQPHIHISLSQIIDI